MHVFIYLVNTNGVLGTYCTGADQSGDVPSTKEQLSIKKGICEAEKSTENERKAKINGPPADSMTLTCSTCSRQFRAGTGLVSHQRTHQHI